MNCIVKKKKKLKCQQIIEKNKFVLYFRTDNESFFHNNCIYFTKIIFVQRNSTNDSDNEF